MKKNSARLGTKPSKKPKKAKAEKLPAAYRVETLYKPTVNRLIYDPDFHPGDFIQHCKEGNTPNMICAYWGISKHTLGGWTRKHKEFRRAYVTGATAFRAFWETKVVKYSKGELTWREFNLSAFSMLAKQTMRWGDVEGSDAFDSVDENPYQLIDVSTGQITDSNLNPVDSDDEFDL